MKSAILGVAALFWAATAGAAGATALGDTVSMTYAFPDLSADDGLTASPNPFVVAEGQVSVVDLEFSLMPISFAQAGGLDVFTFSLSEQAFTGAAFNGPVLSDLTGPNFGGVTSVTGLAAGRVVSTGGQLRLNLQGLSFADGSEVVVQLGASPAPEPAVWTTMVLGLGLAGAAFRRRARVQAGARRCA